ncbi:MAG: DoxX family protein [Acidobacteriota bacterium]|nr:DoxX family protein [Acidobacteriota bacterium]
MYTYLQPLARALTALIFLISGAFKIIGFGQTEAMMASIGIPMPALALVVALVAELAGALALLLGYQTRLAAALLVLYLVPVTLTIHAPQMFAPGQEGQNQMIHVLKNIAIVGGLLKFFTDGAGAYSLDSRRVDHDRAA